MKNEHFHKYLYVGLACSVGVIVCIVFFFVLYRFDLVMGGLGLLQSILMPFVYGAVIAYLLAPVCNWAEVHTQRLVKGKLKEHTAARLSAAAGIIFSMGFGILVVYLLLAMILPQVYTSIVGIIEVLPENIRKWGLWIEQILADNEVLGSYVEEFGGTVYQSVENWLETKLLPNMQTIVTGVSAGVAGVLTVLKNLLIGIIAAVYMLGKRKQFAAQAKKLIYSIFRISTANHILKEVQYINHVFGGFINGKLLDSLIIGILCFIVLNIMKMPYTMLISVIVGVTNIIPFFGPFFGAIPSAIIVLTVSPIQCIYFLIFIFILQQFDGNILGPKILGDTTGISSFWVLFSILLFGGLLGFVGMVIGVPTFAVIYDLIKKWTNKHLCKKNLSTDTQLYQELAAVETKGDTYCYIQNDGKEAAEEGKVK